MATTISPIETDINTALPSHQPTYDQISTTQLGLNTTQFSIDVEAYLQQLSDQNALIFLPDIILIGIFSIIGTISNSMIIYIYTTKFKPSSTRSAIVALASLDLMTSCLSMPGEITILRFAYNFPNDVLCKCHRTSLGVFVCSSFLVLAVLTHDRYRRICHPMEVQLTAEKAKKRILLCILTAALLSVFSLFVYGVTKNPIESKGNYSRLCYYKESSILTLMNLGLHATVFCTVVGTIFVLYCLIARTILRQRKLRKTQNPQNPKPKKGTDHPDTGVTRDVHQCDVIVCSLSPGMDATHDESCHPHRTNDQEIKTGFKKKIFSSMKTFTLNKIPKPSSGDDMRTRKTTRMLFIITIVFIASCIPYITTNALITSGTLTGAIPFFGFLARSFFFNSVTNCFIYVFCCPKFRSETIRLFTKSFERCKIK